ncbi:Dipeptidyl aminopeptidase/acylaminoacyl peptidase [Brevibacterium iodinum ATCC 49514]|uniref:Dipeptidyl aminopeptidase/acylaminoacyl peptidase n=1 Tax=Brevibacterium iodinum ATCC 49514 TaxID=1255616 RepID=A0A2H1JRA2_9MICO|nr:alpha/beta fold hydrolase [Brevibacterium iodinum]SMX90020.1 Dipeptidyl aminopeptidase/acylaminoacyl peptidase [Brevibacterium iodinum ATCC 49514]SUW13918.1 Prolyl tripeptidyl peptidase precursor [Brevibacterium iodinum]
MTTHDAVTRLLDARRLQGLLTNQSGRVIAQYSFLNSEGNSSLSHLADISGETPRRITRGDQSVGPAALSENGTIVFASKRKGEDGKDAESPSLWALPDNGEARKLADHEGGFSRIEVKGETIIVEFPVHTWAADENDHQEFSTERSNAKVSGILHTGFPVRRWDHDLGPGRQTLAVATLDEAAADFPEVSDELSAPAGLDFRYLSLPSGRLVDWAVDDGARFALVQLEKPIPGQLEASEIWRVDLDGERELHRLTKPSADHSFDIEAISPDGTKALVTRVQNWTPQTNLSAELMVLDLETAELNPVWSDADFWFSPIWADDSTIVATADDHGRGSIFIGDINNAQPRRLVGGADQKYSFSGLALREDTVVATASAIDVAPLPISVDLGTGVISELANPATVLEEEGTLTEVEVRAEDGTQIRAWLVLPEGEGPHPLVVFAHGGPWGSWNAWTYRWNPGPFAAAGYAVLLPDPAISTGYGQAMIDRGQQQLGGTPFTDIMALTEAAGERTDIDSERVALAGGSYGGYMANWVAGHTGSAFKCIVTHASLWNTTSMGRTTDNSSWDQAMREQSAQYSPHLFADDIEVPMLVIHGDKDYRVPIGQGQELWLDLLTRAKTPLDADGDTQHRFLYFPDEGHWILGRGNAEVWYRTVLAFLDTHVLGIDANRVRTLG